MALLTSILFLLTLTATASAQDSALCNSSFPNANASGVVTFNVGIPDVPDPSWAVTVEDDPARGVAHSNIWYSTGGQNYSDDLALGYDVCAFFVGQLPVNTRRLGQTASNNCEGMITPRCLDTLLTRASASAFGYVQSPSPPPYSNLSAGVLPTICSYIMTDLSDDDDTTWPPECWKEFGNEKDSTTGIVGAPIDSVALTGYNESGFADGCELQIDSSSFNLAQTSSVGATYDTATRQVYPILSVYFPVANVERTSSIGNAISRMTCLRVDDFSEVSRVSPTLPSGKPYHYGSSLGGGAIAGIVVGALALIGLIAGLAIWWVLRRRRRQRGVAAIADTKGGTDQSEALTGNELGGGDVYELSPDDRKPEMGEQGVYELSPEDKKTELSPESQRYELPGERAVELDGESHGARPKDRI